MIDYDLSQFISLSLSPALPVEQAKTSQAHPEHQNNFPNAR
jgi:hypothetical protein